MAQRFQTRTLDDLCDIVIGRTPSRSNPKYWDIEKKTSNVWLSIADLANATNDLVSDSREYVSDTGAELCKLVYAGELMVSFKLTLGRIAFAARDVFTNEAIASLRLRQPEALSKYYLAYFLLHFDWVAAAKDDEKLMGMTFNKAKLRRILVPCPLIEEQLRIVSVLDRVFENIDAAIIALSKSLQLARELFDSLLVIEMEDGKKGWTPLTLKAVSLDYGRGRSRHRPRNDPKLYGGQYPFVQTGDIRNAKQFVETYSQTYNEVGLSQSKLWPSGTLCITIAANIAETAVLSFPACFPDSVIGVVVDPTKTSVAFLDYQIRLVKNQLKALGKGMAQDNINLGTFESRSFFFPALSEQARITEKLTGMEECVDRLCEQYEAKRALLNELKRSLLERAFSGNL